MRTFYQGLVFLGAIFFISHLSMAESRDEEQPVRMMIIDDDIGMLRKMVLRDGSYQNPWLKITDPDGGLELIYALREPKIKVLGITCSMGCSTTDVCMASAKKILELTARTDVPLYRGANSPDDLGKPTEAAKFIIETVMGNPGKVEIIATAPLTNIATAMMLEPRLSSNWKMLHFATGEFWGALGEESDGMMFSKLSGYQDMNINVDVKATRYVLENAGEKIIIYPNELMDEAFLTRAHLKELRRSRTALAKWVVDETCLFNAITGIVMKGMPLHGIIPLALAIEPELAEHPKELRFTLADKGRYGYVFALSNDQRIPLRPVYLRLRNAQAIENHLVERCK